MTWEIGVSTGTFYPFQTMERGLRTIAEAGFGVAELFLQTPSEYTALYGRRILRTMLAGGVRVHSIHLNMKDMDPFSPYAPRAHDADMLLRQALELARTVGARVVNWHGARRDEVEGGLDPAWLWDTMSRWHEWAREAELTLTLENVSWCMLGTPEEVRAARAKMPDLAFTFDSFQAAESLVSPVAVIEAMQPQIATVHLSDFDPAGARHLVPGAGSIAWPALLGALATGGYAGPLLIEISHLTEESYPAALAQSRAFLDEVIDAVGLTVRAL